MKYLFSLILMLAFFVPTFVLAEEVVEVTDGRLEVYYHGESSAWICLDDGNYKKSCKIRYFDKDGLPVQSLSLNDNDKVLAEIKYPEDSSLPGEVLSLQLYDSKKNVHENYWVSQKDTADLGVGDVPPSEDKPLYKENGVWKN